MTTQYSILFKQEQAHDDAIWSVAWGTNKKDNLETVVTGSLDDLVKVWKWQDERLDLQWSLEGHQLGVVSVDISHTLPIAASSSLDAHIRLWDLENGKQIKSIDAGPVDAWTLAFSPDSQYLATGTHVGKVNIFGVESGKKEYSLDTRGKFILSIAYSPDGKYLASGAIDGIINIFDIATGKLLHTLEGHAMPIRSLTFSPDSQLLVTASDDGYIKIYDVCHAPERPVTAFEPFLWQATCQPGWHPKRPCLLGAQRRLLPRRHSLRLQLLRQEREGVGRGDQDVRPHLL
ncbi:PREDICTED: WD repeat-containing protein 61 isoform X2 [Dipodomys ordii]|uniref:Superkiller complex protein 8 n=1 Tax=Dipodomys ordii TaxID=10020 RepID=A0A1S3EUJ3_DIPOR|nr:PREDICTED: WD repeat-containing protein 61 isoform X2 [Dipodomys ordii]